MGRQRKAKQGRGWTPEAARRRFPARVVLIAAALVAVAAAGVWWPRTPDPGFERLVGRWQRTDAGYVLEIRGTDAKGALDAAYLNPRPIHVARATASREGTTTKVFVELRDANYPGSTYALTYDPGRDQLEGSYFQAREGQWFQVVFTRLR